MPKVHPTAIIEDGSELADDVVVGPYAFVGPEVTVGAGTQLMQGVIVKGKTTIGARNQVFPYSVLGTIPQDKKYQGEPTRLEIGDDNVIREHVTIHIGTASGVELTKVGDHNLIMASSHIGHDSIIGNHCVLANYTAHQRPVAAPIFAFSPDEKVVRALHMNRSVIPFTMDFADTPEATIRMAIDFLKQRNLVTEGDPCVILSDVLNQDFDTEAILLRKA